MELNSNSITLTVDSKIAKKYNYLIAIINSNSSNNITFSYNRFTGKKSVINTISLFNQNEVSITMDDYSEIYEISNTNPGFYKFTLERENFNYLKNCIEIYDNNFNLLSKSPSINELAFSDEGENSIVLNLNATGIKINNNYTPYYLRIKKCFEETTDTRLIINYVVDCSDQINENLEIYKTVSCTNGDEGFMLDFQLYANLEISFECIKDFDEKNININIIKYNNNYQYLEFNKIVESNFLTFNTNINFNSNEKIIILITLMLSMSLFTGCESKSTVYYDCFSFGEYKFELYKNIFTLRMLSRIK